MPDYPGIDFAGGVFRPTSAQHTKTVRIGFVDPLGNTSNLIMDDLGDTVNATEQNELRDSVAKLSNAGVYFDEVVDGYEIQIPDAVAWSEAGAQVSNKGVFVFVKRNNDRDRRYVEIPAFRLKYVTAGSKIINTDDADVTAAINKSLAVLNKRFSAEADKYRFEKAYFSDRKGDGERKAVIPDVTDPPGDGVTP